MRIYGRIRGYRKGKNIFALSEFLYIWRKRSEFYRLKKMATIILLAILVYSFLFSVFIYRKSHSLGYQELALALNLKGRDVKHKTSESFKTIALVPLRWIKAKLSAEKVPQLNIDIKFMHN